MDDAKKKLTTSAGAPVADNQNVMTAVARPDVATGYLVSRETCSFRS